MKTLTVKEIDKALLELMEEKPDFVYGEDTVCYYSRGPKGNSVKCTGCIFGQAFQRLGIPIKELQEIDKRVDTTISSVAEYFIENESPHYWTIIQEAQDGGCSWGELKQFFP